MAVLSIRFQLLTALTRVSHETARRPADCQCQPCWAGVLAAASVTLRPSERAGGQAGGRIGFESMAQSVKIRTLASRGGSRRPAGRGVGRRTDGLNWTPGRRGAVAGRPPPASGHDRQMADEVGRGRGEMGSVLHEPRVNLYSPVCYCADSVPRFESTGCHTVHYSTVLSVLYCCSSS